MVWDRKALLLHDVVNRPSSESLERLDTTSRSFLELMDRVCVLALHAPAISVHVSSVKICIAIVESISSLMALASYEYTVPMESKHDPPCDMQ